MSKKIELREYQKESVKEVSFSLSRGLRTLLCLPTGAGKTLVAKEIVDEYLDAGLTVLWITHRCELKSQVLGVFGENARFEVCLVKSRSSLKKVDLIVVDEAHHSAAPSYRSHFKQFPKAKVFGLSATPVRLDGKSLKDYFDIIIQPRSALTSALINQGFLADIELFVPDSTELNLCGEVIANSLNVRKSVLDGLKFIEGRKGITFCVNKAHALAVAEEFQRNGIEAEAIDSETPYDDRMKLADRWNENKIQVIVNCELYTEGSDLPGVDFVQILRPTESLSLYFQMIGRGMRPGPPMRLLDHTSNWKTIGLPKDDFIFTLDAGNEDAYFKLADEVKKIRREKQSGDQPEHVDLGDLVEFNLRDWYDQLKESREPSYKPRGVQHWTEEEVAFHSKPQAKRKGLSKKNKLKAESTANKIQAAIHLPKIPDHFFSSLQGKILSFFQEIPCGDHLSTERIYTMLHNNVSTIHVIHALNLMTQTGLLGELDLGDGHKYYEDLCPSNRAHKSQPRSIASPDAIPAP